MVLISNFDNVYKANNAFNVTNVTIPKWTPSG